MSNKLVKLCIGCLYWHINNCLNFWVARLWEWVINITFAPRRKILVVAYYKVVAYQTLLLSNLLQIPTNTLLRKQLTPAWMRNYTLTLLTLYSVALVKFIYFIGSCDSSAPPAVCHPPSFTSLPRAGASSTGCSIVIGSFGCPSSALYRGIGFLPELRPSWRYLSHCERLTALPAPPTAPAPSSSSKEGRRKLL